MADYRCSDCGRKFEISDYSIEYTKVSDKEISVFETFQEYDLDAQYKACWPCTRKAHIVEIEEAHKIYLEDKYNCPLAPTRTRVYTGTDTNVVSGPYPAYENVQGHHEYRVSRVPNNAESFYYCIYCMKEVSRIR